LPGQNRLESLPAAADPQNGVVRGPEALRRQTLTALLSPEQYCVLVRDVIRR
jgi:hypothetical protein